MLGLSLGTDVVHKVGEEERPILRTVEELSICEQPRRRGCWIIEADGVRYNTATMAASGAQRTYRRPLPIHAYFRTVSHQLYMH